MPGANARRELQHAQTSQPKKRPAHRNVQAVIVQDEARVHARELGRRARHSAQAILEKILSSGEH